jgi:hypothetical protein
VNPVFALQSDFPYTIWSTVAHLIAGIKQAHGIFYTRGMNNMLMEKYIFTIQQDNNGYLHTIVTRLKDGRQKYFFQCSGTVEGLTKHMESMTDELMESNFPRTDKKGKVVGDFDNWQYLGRTVERNAVEEQARIELTHWHASHTM